MIYTIIIMTMKGKRLGKNKCGHYAHCLWCHQKVKLTNVEKHIAKNGQKYAQGKCPRGHKVTTFIAKKC